jgi:Flp pilus assembly protein TadG
MAHFKGLLRRFSRRQDGAVAVEFAFIGPILVVMLLGIAGWGGYFWVSHAVQQVTNDAARAAMGGLDNTERVSLANSVLATEIDDYAWLQIAHAQVAVTTVGQTVSVTVTYDASQTPFWVMKSIVPMPSTTVARTATVRLGGY